MKTKILILFAVLTGVLASTGCMTWAGTWCGETTMDVINSTKDWDLGSGSVGPGPSSFNFSRGISAPDLSGIKVGP